VPEIHDVSNKADTLARRLTEQATLADALSDDMAATLTELNLNGVGDTDDLAERPQATLKAMAAFHVEVAHLARELDALQEDSDEIAYALETLQHDREATSDLAGIALDVERGIRDPDELSRAVHEAAGLAL
jgi:hypothetical protein